MFTSSEDEDAAAILVSFWRHDMMTQVENILKSVLVQVGEQIRVVFRRLDIVLQLQVEHSE